MAGDSLDNIPGTIRREALGGHGHDNRGFEAGAIPGTGYGRYGRMFAFSGRPLPDGALTAIADAMVKADASPAISDPEEVDENPAIPAGYTYFGQFVDHDITFDPSPISVDRMDMAAMEDFRTPALDLDSLYGRGPDDQPYMYHDDGLRLREGAPVSGAQPVNPTKGPRDLPRIAPVDDPAAGKWRAIIGDKRNDENRIVSQLHAAMIRFHNKIVMDDTLIAQFGGDPGDPQSRFRAAVNCVRWHYQWVVVHDLLDRRLLKPGTIAKMLGADGTPALRCYDKVEARYAYLPVEFAGAAYRIGHSMVRPGYSLNAKVTRRDPQPVAPKGGKVDQRIPIFGPGDARQNLNGLGVRLPDDWAIDWSFFLDVPTALDPKQYHLPQPSYRLDAMLVAPLSDLPEFAGAEARFRMLAYRNLRRGCNVLRLPSGEQIAKAIGVPVLTPQQLWMGMGSGKAMPNDLAQDDVAFNTALLNRRSAVWAEWQQQLSGNTPLWYYVLREAELAGTEHAPGEKHIGYGGQHLGPVGSLILAETFLGLLWRDENSYLRRWPAFTPVLPKRGATFDLGDMLLYAYG